MMHTLVLWLVHTALWATSNVEPGYPEMVFVPGGTFIQGDSLGNADEKPQRQVRLDRFHISKTEVTIAQFRAFIEATGYQIDAERGEGSYIWSELGWVKKAGVSWRCDEKGVLRLDSAGTFPVMHVSWRDAAYYCNWLSATLNLQAVYAFEADSVKYNPSATGFRLPTEAEWEYAAGSGKEQVGFRGAWDN